MTRAYLLGLVLFATVAASPPSRLPVPPIPPLHPPLDEAAPLPDRDFAGPIPEAPRGPQVMLHDFRVSRFSRSMGYTPGSEFESSEEKRPIQTPGVSVRFPLQQR
jgi:hypothetical protein